MFMKHKVFVLWGNLKQGWILTKILIFSFLKSYYINSK